MIDVVYVNTCIIMYCIEKFSFCVNNLLCVFVLLMVCTEVGNLICLLAVDVNCYSALQYQIKTNVKILGL